MHIAIIGGGIAGIAAAWKIRQTGARVTLIETRPYLGGRLTSHTGADSPTFFDNGAHLFLSTYTQSRRLFRSLGISNDFEYPWPGAIPFATPNGQRHKLQEWPLPSPWNLAAGLLGFTLLPWPSRCRTVAASRELLSIRIDASLSAGEWLSSRVNEEEQNLFWRPLIRSALNSDPEKIPVKYLQIVFREGFCRGFFGGRPGYARKPLGKIFDQNVRQVLTDEGIEVILKSPAMGPIIEKNRVTAIRLKGDVGLLCDAAVAALPPWGLREWLSSTPEGERIAASYHLDAWTSTPISSLYLWADQRPILEAFTCLPGGNIDWIFDYARIWGIRQAPLCLLLRNSSTPSQAEPLDSTRPKIPELLTEAIAAFPQLSKVRWKAYKLIREGRATPNKPRKLWGQPLPQTTSIPNLFLAGDWLDPNLPPTVEAAVRSGERVKELVCKSK